jgi:predicted DNA-binding transcriptional regulator AlpA
MEKLAYSVSEFCALHGISRSAFYKSLNAGLAPKLMRVGSRILISREAAAEWRRAREQAEAATS